MEPTPLDLDRPTEKIYEDNAIWVGSLLGGPLVAGYLIAENFKAFDESAKATKTWIYTIIATIIIFGCIFLIPENVKIPNHIIPVIYTGIAYYLVQRLQGKNISTHISSGGQSYSWWRTIAVAVIGFVITIIPIVGFVLLSDIIANASLSTKTYGIMKHEISFDKSSITEAEVDQLANGLIETTFFDEAETKYVYAEKVNNTYELSISVIAGIVNDGPVLQRYIYLRTDLQTLFPNNKIVFKLVVDNLDNVVKKLE